ncbi:MAG: hypothetical protein K2X98_01400 [Alphaproteobacteria bacterium]|nr:hypothetical protein [Alphaproteobacteria bacterium]
MAFDKTQSILSSPSSMRPSVFGRGGHVSSPLAPTMSGVATMPSSVEGIQGFKDALVSGNIAAPAMTLGDKPITADGAMKAAQDVMQGFYTQMLKMLFAEIKSEDSDDNEYQSSMVKDIFVEQMGAALGKNITSSHEKIAQAMLTKARMRGETPTDFSPESIEKPSNDHTVSDVSRMRVNQYA